MGWSLVARLLLIVIVPVVGKRGNVAETSIGVRSQRQRTWLWIDHEVLDVYGEEMGSSGIAVYVALCRFANHETQTCWPSVHRLTKVAGLTRKTVIATIVKLEKLGLISADRSPGKSTVYSILDTSVKEALDQGKIDTGRGVNEIPEQEEPKEKKEQKKPTASKADPDVDRIVAHFEDRFGLTMTQAGTQRNYARHLMAWARKQAERTGTKVSPVDAVCMVIDLAARMRDDQYAPRVTDIKSLYYKANAVLEAARKKNKQAEFTSV